MKFGKHLVAVAVPEWYVSGKYVPYKALKADIKKIVVGKTRLLEEWSETDPDRQPTDEEVLALSRETKFTEGVLTALDTVNEFSAELCQDIEEHLQEAEDTISDLEEKGYFKAGRPVTNFTGSKDLNKVRELLSSLFQRAQQLVRYTGLNSTAFRKILKKHDKLVKVVRNDLRTQIAAAPFTDQRGVDLSKRIQVLVAKVQFDGDSAHAKTHLLSSTDAQKLEMLRSKKGYIIDMDGVIYHAKHLLPGVRRFVAWMRENNKRFLFLTNASDSTKLQLSQKLARLGLNVDPSHFHTSAIATASFLSSQKPYCSAFVLGTDALKNALEEESILLTTHMPDYVVVGESLEGYSTEQLQDAIDHVLGGARLIGTNVDLYDRVGDSRIPSCGSLIAPIEKCTERTAFFCGKPSPITMRVAMRKLGLHTEDVAIIGDRMDTDILAGVQSQVFTALVLTGVTTRTSMVTFPYVPDVVLEGVSSIPHHDFAFTDDHSGKAD